MIVRRYISTASVVCSLTFGFAGHALAADVDMNTTGPDSNQTVTITDDSSVTVSNTNDVQVSNVNVQSAVTGDTSAKENTTVGGAGSGNASNNNSTATSVNLTNDTDAVLPVGGNGQGTGGNGEGVGNVGGAGQNVGGQGAGTPGRGAGVLGAATVGGMGSGAVLPEVGAKFPVDVSALRAAWQPQANAPATVLAKGSRWLTNAMLVTATLLGLLGAIGSAWYARRQERV